MGKNWVQRLMAGIVSNDREFQSGGVGTTGFAPLLGPYMDWLLHNLGTSKIHLSRVKR